jgi:hypothetical protein
MTPDAICAMRGLCSRAETCRHALSEMGEIRTIYFTTMTWGAGCRKYLLMENDPEEEKP